MDYQGYSVAAHPPAAPRAVLVNAIPGEIEMSTAQQWDWDRYDWFLIDGVQKAYGTIRELRPNLIVLLMPMSDREGCHLMSMLRLDDKTADIPIMIYTAVAEPDPLLPLEEEVLPQAVSTSEDS